MKLQVTQENLSKALSNVAKVAMANKNPLPILNNILIKTSDNMLSLSATNLEIAITEKIGSKIQNEGTVTIPARLMLEYISSLPSGVLDLELDENKLHITTEQYKSTINGVASDDFPVIPEVSNAKTLKLSVEECKKGLQQVVFAASSDESRPVLTGILLHVVDSKLIAAATDSYKLAEKVLMNQVEDVSLLIPATAIQELLRILPETANEVTILADNQQVLFKVGDIELVSRLIDAKYPDYKKLIPTTFTNKATLNKQEFISITKVSSLFARESAGSITLKIDQESNQLSITSIATQLGENTSSATAKIEGSGEVTLNSRYLIECLNALEGDEVTFSFNGKLDPCVLSSKKSSNQTYLIMPLKS
jgi:DNA polymerase-3 subunit beta